MELATFERADLERLDGFDFAELGDLVAAQRHHLDDPLCHPHKVVHDGQVVGIGTATDLSPTGWLSYIAVRPDMRRKGIGGGIVDGLVRFLMDARGCRIVSLVATEAGRALYERVGFRYLTEYVVFQAGSPLLGIPPYSDGILPCRPEHQAQVLALDREVCGEDRASVLGEKLEGSYVFLAGAVVQGFLFPDLGEGVVEAVTHQAGLELIRFKASATVSATVYRENAVAIDFLLAQGFRETSRRTRMILGDELSWKPDCFYGL